MRLSLRSTHTAPRPALDPRALGEVAARKLYAEGLADGLIVALDHITNAPGALDPYTGPLPDELREWCEAARARAVRVRETSHAAPS